MLDDALVILLAGGAGERLYPLTRDRAKPAVFFGGPYRIIDFTLSNCINSGLRRIFIATQYKSLSLNRHIRMGWNIVSEELGEFVEILPPQKRVSEHWYQGTADAVYQNLYSIVQEAPHHVIVLSGDHVYKMDYARMLRFHRERGAGDDARGDRGAACRTPAASACCRWTSSDRVTGFVEKAEEPAARFPVRPTSRWRRWASTSSIPKCCCARSKPTRHSRTSHDFGKDIIPALIKEVPTFAYRFYDENKKASKYWRDIGTLDAFYDANMDLCHVDPEFNLYDPEWPMRTYQPQAPPAKFVFAEQGPALRRRRSTRSSRPAASSPAAASSAACCARTCACTATASSSSCILMPGVRVGRHARIRRAIVDRDVLIPRGAVIGYNPEEDRKRHTVTDQGVVVVTEDDDPLVEPISEEALRIEAEDDGR